MKKEVKISIVIVVIVIAFGAWYCFANKNNSTPNLVDNFTPNDNVINAVSSVNFNDIQVDTTDWSIYKNEKDGYNFKYPSNWKIDDITNFQDVEFTYSSVISVRADLNLPINKNHRNVIIYCCSIVKTSAILKNELQKTTIAKINVQELSVNDNKIVILNTGSTDNAEEVFIYLINGDRMFKLNVNTPDIYNKEAYKTAIGIIKTFKVSK